MYERKVFCDINRICSIYFNMYIYNLKNLSIPWWERDQSRNYIWLILPFLPTCLMKRPIITILCPKRRIISGSRNKYIQYPEISWFRILYANIFWGKYLLYYLFAYINIFFFFNFFNIFSMHFSEIIVRSLYCCQ